MSRKKWKEKRDASIGELEFPYESFRGSQRDLSVAVYRVVRDGGNLFAQAPTGTGKTIATLFPAIKAMGQGHTSRIFYLTAKTVGRTVAEKALRDMREAGLLIKSVTLTAKHKICFTGDEICVFDECPYGRHYKDRILGAVKEVENYDEFSRERIEELAGKHRVCPFEFSLDVALRVDCVICDLNYAFDPRVYLKRFFDGDPGRVTFLVDEAHNLPDRLRGMFSATLNLSFMQEVYRRIRPHYPGTAESLAGVCRAMLEIKVGALMKKSGVVVSDSYPEALMDELNHFTGLGEQLLEKNISASHMKGFSELYYDCCAFIKIAEYFGSRYKFYAESGDEGELMVKLFCLDPSQVFRKRLKRISSCIFFSATLLPMFYFRRMLLGKSGKAHEVVLPSPFPPGNFNLIIHRGIATRYRVRDSYLDRIAGLITGVRSLKKGNYMVFFPSYAYMEKVVQLVFAKDPGANILVQKRQMTEEMRQEFLDSFEKQRDLTAFAVMGGIFGEGIDLVGDRLIGVIVVGVGLPQLCLEQDLIRDYFSERGENGFLYAYQLPGFNRVLQAAGRVIRSEKDRGVVILADERFSSPDYLRLFPREWGSYRLIADNRQLENSAFFAEVSEGTGIREG